MCTNLFSITLGMDYALPSFLCKERGLAGRLLRSYRVSSGSTSFEHGIPTTYRFDRIMFHVKRSKTDKSPSIDLIRKDEVLCDSEICAIFVELSRKPDLCCAIRSIC